jgi:hypothetical protein
MRTSRATSPWFRSISYLCSARATKEKTSTKAARALGHRISLLQVSDPTKRPLQASQLRGKIWFGRSNQHLRSKSLGKLGPVQSTFLRCKSHHHSRDLGAPPSACTQSNRRPLRTGSPSRKSDAEGIAAWMLLLRIAGHLNASPNTPARRFGRSHSPCHRSK